MNYTLPLMAVLIWSVNTVVSKLAAGAIAPAEIGLLRWVVAAVILTPFLLPGVWRQRAAIRPLIGKIIVLGLLGMVIYQSLAYYAANFTSATHMGIILTLSPMMVLGLTVLLLGQPLTQGAVAGSLLAIVGVVLVVSAGDLTHLLAGGLNRGDLLMLIAALAYAAYNVLLKRWSLPITTWQLLYLQMMVAVVAQLPLYLASNRVGLNAHNLPLVLFAGTAASIAAPFLWMKAVAKLGPDRASMFFNLTPLFTALIASFALNEHMNGAQWLGGVLTVAGVLLAERWRTPVRGAMRPAQP